MHPWWYANLNTVCLKVFFLIANLVEDRDYEDINDDDWSVSVYKSETKPSKKRPNLKDDGISTKIKTGIKCQPIIESIKDDDFAKPLRKTKSEASNKMKCEAIIEEVGEDEVYNYKRRRRSKFSE